MSPEDSHISIYLTMKEKSSSDYDIKFKIGIMGKATPGDNVFCEKYKKTGEDFEDGTGWGEPKIIHHDELFEQDGRFVVNGELTIICEVRSYSFSLAQSKDLQLFFR
jgi:hypothetical protein